LRKGYKAFHEFEKSDKGHHDAEKHKHEYDEEDGEEKKDHEEAGHYGEEHHGEEGEKNAKFGEEGKHQKGYSTKGEHSVFKKVRMPCEEFCDNKFPISSMRFQDQAWSVMIIIFIPNNKKLEVPTSCSSV